MCSVFIARRCYQNMSLRDTRKNVAKNIGKSMGFNFRKSGKKSIGLRLLNLIRQMHVHLKDNNNTKKILAVICIYRNQIQLIIEESMFLQTVQIWPKFPISVSIRSIENQNNKNSSQKKRNRKLTSDNNQFPHRKDYQEMTIKEVKSHKNCSKNTFQIIPQVNKRSSSH